MLPQRPLLSPPVGRDGDEEDLGRGGRLVLFAHVVVVLEDLRDQPEPEVLAVYQPRQLALHLRRGHHLHGLRDLLDAAHRLHPVLHRLLVGRETPLDRRLQETRESLR